MLLGQLEGGAQARLNETVSNLRLGQAVSLPGHLEDEDYWRLLSEADVAVQLRHHSDGEASGSVCDCLAARLPTIVSAIGWLNELPEPAVLRVRRDCEPAELAATMSRVVGEAGLRERICAAQDEYAAANSYGRVAELLAL
jgi:glycosyltransferase involved in cell wall biosynthesis